MDLLDAFVVCVVVAILAAIPSCAIGANMGEKFMMHKAYEAGVAEYYLDENNNKQFRWKTPGKDAANENQH